MCMSVCRYVNVLVGSREARCVRCQVSGHPGPEITGSCKLIYLGVRNQTLEEQ